MGKSFYNSKKDDFFYLLPEAFDNPDFQTSLQMFVLSDSKPARFFITHQSNPMTPEDISRVTVQRTVIQEGLKQSSWMRPGCTLEVPQRPSKTCTTAPNAI